MALSVNGEHKITGVGSEVLGNPHQSLVWMANFLRVRGKGLKAGDCVTTGSTATADFGEVGQVQVSFTA